MGQKEFPYKLPLKPYRKFKDCKTCCLSLSILKQQNDFLINLEATTAPGVCLSIGNGSFPLEQLLSTLTNCYFHVECHLSLSRTELIIVLNFKN